MSDETLDRVRHILGSVLNLGNRIDRLSADSKLLGDIPEFDSMAVVGVITALEERFGIVVEDDDISADTFETLASLADFVRTKL